MRELLHQVPEGLRELMSGGKLLLLFLVVLLLAWYLQMRQGNLDGRKSWRDALKRSGERWEKKEETPWYDVWSPGPGGKLLRYATLVFLLAAFPLTGLLIRVYQTRFYDYAWVTAYLPLTALTAYGIAGIWPMLCEKYCGKSFWKIAGLTAMGLGIFALCGNMSGAGEIGDEYRTELTKGWDWLQQGRNGLLERENREGASYILDYLRQIGNTEDICLWAPADILEYMRGMDGEIRLLYGRNMWEESLNAYSYEVYSDELKEAYRWMEDWYLVLWGKRQSLPGEEEMRAAMGTALENGVNCILFPSDETEGIPLPEKNAEAFRILEAGRAFAPVLEEEVDRLLEESGLSVAKEQIPGYVIYRIGT